MAMHTVMDTAKTTPLTLVTALTAATETKGYVRGYAYSYDGLPPSSRPNRAIGQEDTTGMTRSVERMLEKAGSAYTRNLAPHGRLRWFPFGWGSIWVTTISQVHSSLATAGNSKYTHTDMLQV